MAIIDVIILLILVFFIGIGFAFGFIKTITGLISTIISIFLASHLVGVALNILDLSGGTMKVIFFVILFVIISKIIRVLFWFLRKILDLMAYIPFLGFFDRILGSVLGLIQGLVIVAVVLFFASKHLPEGILLSMLEASAVAKPLIAAVTAMQILFPEALRIASR